MAAQAKTSGIEWLSATQCSAMLALGDITAVELLDEILTRTAKINPTLNAITEIDQNTALKAAEAADARYRLGQQLGPLDGVPITVKDNLGVQGMKATWGSKLFADHICCEDDAAIDRLRRAGAVIWAKTNLPEFALAGVTESPLYGITRNPWNLDHTPGGSSGGAAAALAAGLGPLALGTDAGGSARRPAAYTGVVGFRPSNGMIPRRSMFPTTTYDLQVISPMARTVSDVHLLFDALAGAHNEDRSSIIANLHANSRLDTREPVGLRILFFPTVGEMRVESEIAAATLLAANRLESLGHRVIESDAPFSLDEIERIWSVIAAAGIASVADTLERPVSELSPMVRGMIDRGRMLTAVDYSDALKSIQCVRHEFDRLLERYDILLCPTSPCFSWPVGSPFPSTIAGSPAGPRDAAIFLTFPNAAGIPAISIPFARSQSNHPIGIQLAAAFGNDARLLSIAAQLEAVSEWYGSWPDL